MLTRSLTHTLDNRLNTYKAHVQLPVSVTGKDTYIRDTLSVGDVSITFYRHESLTQDQVLDRLVEHYKAWAVNRPGGRLPNA